MPVIGMLLVLLLVVVIVAPVTAAIASRAAINAVQARHAVPVEDAATEARLSRIEEAIDAMADQIERLALEQRRLAPPREVHGARGPGGDAG
jgi:sensor domain CHASE-containing protein